MNEMLTYFGNNRFRMAQQLCQGPTFVLSQRLASVPYLYAPSTSRLASSMAAVLGPQSRPK